ncbi:hypothetical protein OG349_19015 [Streptomyces sp. NBC_01317]|uniref:hypothetical protein n=1 Tax=Streptomyces sp. NBC_01317 TaxID=2903822 RepID=UPI002E1249E5|nr:hypothetical protein OG349_19015 [Streptomyces sp. NBC_01317]
MRRPHLAVRALLRLRVQRTTWPRHALILTDTPRPNCPDCGGNGGHSYDYGDHETGEYAGTDWWSCPCWIEDRRWVLLPLPHCTPSGGYSDEPPF